MSSREPKLISVTDAAALVTDGSHLAVGGIWNYNVPSALLRGLLRTDASDLTVSSSPASAYGTDLLLASGRVCRAYLPNVTFEDLGMAPNYRHARETGNVRLVPCDETTLIGGYKAAAAGLPFIPVTSIVGTTYADELLAAGLVTPGDDGTLLVPPLRPDIVFLHVQEADVFGNGRHLGAVFADRLLAKASTTVVISADRIVDHDVLRTDPRAVTIPSHWVSYVVHTQKGAWPCGSHGLYDPDSEHLRRFLAASKARIDGNEAVFTDYWNDAVRDYTA